MQASSIFLTLAVLALLGAVALGLNLQFGRRPIRYARTGLGVSMGLALAVLGAAMTY